MDAQRCGFIHIFGLSEFEGTLKRTLLPHSDLLRHSATSLPNAHLVLLDCSQ